MFSFAICFSSSTEILTPSLDSDCATSQRHRVDDIGRFHKISVMKPRLPTSPLDRKLSASAYPQTRLPAQLRWVLHRPFPGCGTCRTCRSQAERRKPRWRKFPGFKLRAPDRIDSDHRRFITGTGDRLHALPPRRQIVNPFRFSETDQNHAVSADAGWRHDGKRLPLSS